MIGWGIILIVVGILAAVLWVPYAGALVFAGVVLVVVGAIFDAGTWGWHRRGVR